jgi:hypothetical protein
MKREILFKAQRTYGKGWVEGDLIHGVGSKKGSAYILPRIENLANLKGCDPLDGYKVLPATVCQHTGLKDKNGVKIFEGDVLDLGQTVNGCRLFNVIYSEGRIGWSVEYAENMATPREYEYDLKSFFEIDTSTSEGVEVTGNIHDND